MASGTKTDRELNLEKYNKYIAERDACEHGSREYWKLHDAAAWCLKRAEKKPKSYRAI